MFALLAKGIYHYWRCVSGGKNANGNLRQPIERGTSAGKVYRGRACWPQNQPHGFGRESLVAPSHLLSFLGFQGLVIVSIPAKSPRFIFGTGSDRLEKWRIPFGASVRFSLWSFGCLNEDPGARFLYLRPELLRFLYLFFVPEVKVFCTCVFFVFLRRESSKMVGLLVAVLGTNPKWATSLKKKHPHTAIDKWMI